LPCDRLDPAECLLDALADGIAAVPGRPPVDRSNSIARSSFPGGIDGRPIGE
jgi:hypothetical protein